MKLTIRLILKRENVQFSTVISMKIIKYDPSWNTFGKSHQKAFQKPV